MLVAFLDMLGFSHLVKQCPEAARDNYEWLKTKFHNRMTDKYSPKDQDWTFSACTYAVLLGDSVVLAADDSHADQFVRQTAHFVARLFIEYARPFTSPFEDITAVPSLTDCDANGKFIRAHSAAPLLMRGGIAWGTDMFGDRLYGIWDGQRVAALCPSIMGLTYINAVSLEDGGQGPRIFCDQEVVNALNDKSLVRRVSADLFEIVWPYLGCESLGDGDETGKAGSCLGTPGCESMLAPAIELYNYYSQSMSSDQLKNDHVMKKYEQLVNVICAGILRYAQAQGNVPRALEDINRMLGDRGRAHNLTEATTDLLADFV